MSFNAIRKNVKLQVQARFEHFITVANYTAICTPNGKDRDTDR